jgi:peptide/nickel transport system permease protein
MLRFLVRRVVLGVLVLLMVLALVFGIFFVGNSPTGIAYSMAGKNANAHTVALIIRRLHLKEPVPVQFWDFLKQVVWHHNLGFSYFNGVPVAHLLSQAFPKTLSLAIGAAIIWLLLGVISGVISAVRRSSLLDRVITTLALFFYSVPTFVLGVMLLFLVSFQLQKRGIRFFPGQGYVGPSQSVSQWFEHLILPWLTLALVSAATYTRLTRGTLLEVLGEDYIRTARAKGLTERRVIFRHGLRSALTPVASQFGIDVGTLVGGAIVTETVFGIPGLGYTAVKAIGNGDLPVILGIVIVASTAVVVANIVIDVFYAVLDPRVRLH